MAREDDNEAMNSIEDSSGNKLGTDETPAARRARLRPSLKQSNTPDPSSMGPAVNNADPSGMANASATLPLSADAISASAQFPDAGAKAGSDNPSIVNVNARRSEHVEIFDTAGSSAGASPAVSQGRPGARASTYPEQSFSGGHYALAPETQSLEVLNNIDQSMAACATNLATLERVAQEQSEALKALTETLKNHTFGEVGLNLGSLTESLAAALEPMKAVGELVPAVDQLVAAIQGTDSTIGEGKLSREQLVTSLADQLSTGLIDPWTFKCAYMAVYPSDHPADLLHRLVDLLGTQRLSGDLFRAAYEAVQAAEVPAMPIKATRRRASKKSEGEAMAAMAASSDEEGHSEELPGDLDSTPHRDLLESQEAMDARLQELDSRFKDLETLLHERELELKQKSAQLADKDSENQQLKAQMEELRDQTKDLVADLQKQLTQTKTDDKDEPAPQGKQNQSQNQGQTQTQGFFDISPGQSSNLFESPQSKSLFDLDSAASSLAGAPSKEADRANPAGGPQSGGNAGKAVGRQVTGETATPNAAPQDRVGPAQPVLGPGPQMPNRPSSSSTAITTPMAGPGLGSYGSGVRAQVFEVIVRQALAGAPWQDICSGPMQVNNISPEEVEAEVKRRQALLKK